MDFLDELSAGLPVVAAPDLQGEFGLRYATVALLLFVVPEIVGLVLEPPIYLLADRVPRRRFVVGGIVALGACDLIAGLSWSLAPLALALAFAGAASGVGVNLAQATLMDDHPEDRERMMALWALAGMGGDFLAPALFWLLATFALGWRAVFLLSALLLFSYASVLGRQSFPSRVASDDEEDSPGVWGAIRMALGNRRLLIWLLGVWLCGMLDEVLVAFGSIHLRERLGLDVAERSLVLMAFVGGSIAGLLIAERLLRQAAEPMAMLRWSAAACALSYAAWILAPSVGWSALLLAVVGASAAPLYPIAQAQAYRALPGRSGMVNAVSVIFRPLDVALPLVVGVAADRLGLSSALTLLLAQPLGLLAIGCLADAIARDRVPKA